MNELMNILKNFHDDECGAGSTEYILLLILVACVIITIVKTFGSTVEQKYANANLEVEVAVDF
jgi:Flp pilus assembly pilin Flp